jgi:hypothetical protein
MPARHLTAASMLLLACTAAHGDTPREYQELEAMLIKSLEAYNKDDIKGIFANFVDAVTQFDTTPYYDTLFKPHKATCGKFRKLTFQKVGSAHVGDFATMTFEAEFEKKKARVSANFFKENGKMKIQAILIEPK